jgi:hypothetical protein
MTEASTKYVYHPPPLGLADAASFDRGCQSARNALSLRGEGGVNSIMTRDRSSGSSECWRVRVVKSIKSFASSTPAFFSL